MYSILKKYGEIKKWPPSNYSKTMLLYDLERVMGIEPTQLAWKARALPLSYTRRISPVGTTPSDFNKMRGGGGRIRTYVDIRRQIYSLLPLTTRPPLPIPHSQAGAAGERKKEDLAAIVNLKRVGKRSFHVFPYPEASLRYAPPHRTPHLFLFR